MDNLYNYGVVQTLVDMAGFYGGNTIAASAADMSKPKLDETIIFGISDLLIRNQALSMFSNNEMFKGNFGRNAYIGLVSFLLTTGYDLLKQRELSKALKDNLIKNAIGVGSNTVIDLFIGINNNKV